MILLQKPSLADGFLSFLAGVYLPVSELFAHYVHERRAITGAAIDD